MTWEVEHLIEKPKKTEKPAIVLFLWAILFGAIPVFLALLVFFLI